MHETCQPFSARAGAAEFEPELRQIHGTCSLAYLLGVLRHSCAVFAEQAAHHLDVALASREHDSRPAGRVRLVDRGACVLNESQSASKAYGINLRGC